VASAANFIITESDNSTNGVGTIDGGAETSIANNAIDGSDTVSLGVALTTTGTSKGIETSGVINNISVSSSGSITTAGDHAYGIYKNGSNNTTTMSGMVSAIGTGSSALFNSSGSGNSFTLDEGATIIGDITALTAATNNKLTLNLGQSTSYAYSVGGGGAGTGAGQWTFSDQDGRTPEVTTTGTSCAASGVTVCNLVTAIGSGNAMEQDELQFATNRSMIGSLELGSIHTSALTESYALRAYLQQHLGQRLRRDITAGRKHNPFIIRYPQCWPNHRYTSYNQ
jgi:hypothetical protein